MASKESTQLQEAVKSLQSLDSKVRASAAKTLFSAGLREFTKDRKDALGSDEAWNGLLRALSDDDAKVVENAAGAVAQIAGRYRHDLAAFDPLRALLGHKNKQIRTYATRGVGYLDHPERWNVLIPLLDDPVEPVRKAAVIAMVLQVKKMSASERAAAKQAMERSLTACGPEMKMITENAIRVLTDA